VENNTGEGREMYRTKHYITDDETWSNASQPQGCGPVVGHGINYTGPREALLEFVIFIF
jgi:hypothetical protein